MKFLKWLKKIWERQTQDKYDVKQLAEAIGNYLDKTLKKNA